MSAAQILTAAIEQRIADGKARFQADRQQRAQERADGLRAYVVDLCLRAGVTIRPDEADDVLAAMSVPHRNMVTAGFSCIWKPAPQRPFHEFDSLSEFLQKPSE